MKKSVLFLAIFGSGSALADGIVENWGLVESRISVKFSPYMPPEYYHELSNTFNYKLAGDIYDSDKFENGDHIETSKLREFTLYKDQLSGKATTQSGSVYEFKNRNNEVFSDQLLSQYLEAMKKSGVTVTIEE